mmetsp:Transcript_48929/g.72728  ORF Transcript_48929/g.72728 Transcript_48929/m.72728 type:complete len:401 (+) Transcript_48929:56-1258(+)|eukprot:CAMPEP_0195528986 /NCGR_PEP_ID=MMETSP0794_2-20130614/31361_1 /TAXON_ID=515487 /ORGANISM="Stephanopyxis turris, Strain CCMP 815" /LENGTH=400 /DNA_ID=CAMNT_0040660217 /DNA_START=49 /DNA_END=1251 /DNA_ORIENTATION=+
MPEVSDLLTEETVPKYLAERAEEIAVFTADAKLTAKAIVGGNVNYAFRVDEEGTGKSVFVKQAPEFVAIFGPDGFPLTSARMQQEYDVYNEFRSILGDELGAKYLPTIHLFDKKNMVFVLEFFELTLLDEELIGEGSNALIAAGLGEFMGKIHAATHSSKVSEERAKYLTAHYENRAMRDIQLEFVFTKCYKESTEEQRAGLNVDEAFMKEVEMLKTAYNGGNADNLVLSHGDLHPGSVMADDKEVKVIDPEFTVYGPPGLDVGSLLSGYVLAAVHQAFLNKPDLVVSLCEQVDAIWKTYKTTMEKGGISADVMKKIEIETVGFTVAEVCRTGLEFAGGRKWLQFEDEKVKAESKKAALNIVGNCMVARHEGGMELLLSEIKSLNKSQSEKVEKSTCEVS